MHLIHEIIIISILLNKQFSFNLFPFSHSIFFLSCRRCHLHEGIIKKYDKERKSLHRKKDCKIMRKEGIKIDLFSFLVKLQKMMNLFLNMKEKLIKFYTK